VRGIAAGHVSRWPVSCQPAAPKGNAPLASGMPRCSAIRPLGGRHIMDAELAGTIAAVLRPFLKGLVSGAAEIGDDAGNEAGQEARSFAKAIWDRIAPFLESRPTVAAAAKDAVEQPQDDGAAGSLTFQLHRLLEQEPTLRDELRRLVDEDKARGAASIVSQTVGERVVAVGRNSNGLTGTGDT
jgi:hypothetical protein